MEQELPKRGAEGGVPGAVLVGEYVIQITVKRDTRNRGRLPPEIRSSHGSSTELSGKATGNLLKG